MVSRQLAATLETIAPLHPDLSSLSDQTGTKPQAIVILSGGHYDVMPEYGISVPQAAVLERIRYAMHIQRQTNLPILITGGKVSSTNQSEAWIINQVLLNDFQIGAKWLEEESHNTAENAEYSFNILNQEKIQHIYLVTHTSHMSRAANIFQKNGFTVTPAPTIFLSKEGDLTDLMQWLPTSYFLASSRNSLHEILGHWWYKLRHH